MQYTCLIYVFNIHFISSFFNFVQFYLKRKKVFFQCCCNSCANSPFPSKVQLNIRTWNSIIQAKSASGPTQHLWLVTIMTMWRLPAIFWPIRGEEDTNIPVWIICWPSVAWYKNKWTIKNIITNPATQKKIQSGTHSLKHLSKVCILSSLYWEE